MKEKENVRVSARVRGKEMEDLRTRLVKVETQLEVQKKRNKAISAKVSRFPLQKKLAIERAVWSAMQNSRHLPVEYLLRLAGSSENLSCTIRCQRLWQVVS